MSADSIRSGVQGKILIVKTLVLPNEGGGGEGFLFEFLTQTKHYVVRASRPLHAVVENISQDIATRPTNRSQ